MPDQVITHLDQATPEWLTRVLRQSGALTEGAVTALVTETGAGNWSQHARLTVRYTDSARGARPERLFLKLVNADLDDEAFGPSEVLYYTRDYVDVAGAPLIRCYDAAYSDAERRYHLLLDDVTATHLPAGDQAPTLDYGRTLAEGLAALHALVGRAGVGRDRGLAASAGPAPPLRGHGRAGRRPHPGTLPG